MITHSACSPLFLVISILINANVFRPISAIPDEYFTCIDRAPGVYADDKRSCALYWQCYPNGTLEHGRCPSSSPVFHDQIRACVTRKPGECPMDYGNFQSAASFCRGRPYQKRNQTKRGSQDRQPSVQAYYANHLKNCQSYFWCFMVNGTSGGFEFQCPVGRKFDAGRSDCVNEDSVKCPISHGADLV